MKLTVNGARTTNIRMTSKGLKVMRLVSKLHTAVAVADSRRQGNPSIADEDFSHQLSSTLAKHVTSRIINSPTFRDDQWQLALSRNEGTVETTSANVGATSFGPFRCMTECVYSCIALPLFTKPPGIRHSHYKSVEVSGWTEDSVTQVEGLQMLDRDGV